MEVARDIRILYQDAGRVISIEYEYGDNPEPFPLRKLQGTLKQRNDAQDLMVQGRMQDSAQTSSGKRFSPARPLRKWRTY